MNPTRRARGYTYRVRWSPNEGAYVATVAEFPNLGSPGAGPKAAIDTLMALVEQELQNLDRSGLSAPIALVGNAGSRDATRASRHEQR